MADLSGVRTRAARRLYQFPISHYCEKVRFNLDAKGLGYEVHDIAPGFHRRALPRGKTVPVLVDGDVVVDDSTEIALHLERAHPNPPLLPDGEASRQRVLELEDYFDEQAGPAVRRTIYGVLLGTRGAAMAAMFDGYSAPLQILARVFSPLLEPQLRKFYRISDESLAASRVVITECLDRIERETKEDPSRYLVGDALSIADIGAASLLAPIVVPKGTTWERLDYPPELLELREQVLGRPGGEWVLERYRRDRWLAKAS